MASVEPIDEIVTPTRRCRAALCGVWTVQRCAMCKAPVCTDHGLFRTLTKELMRCADLRKLGIGTHRLCRACWHETFD